MKSSGKDKDKKNKGRYLSPSFIKGVVKEKKEDKEDDGEFKINLICADDDESKSPSPNKHKKRQKKKEDQKESKTNITPVKENMKVNAISEGRIKKVGSYSQAGKGEDGFTKVNQDSFLVLQNEYNLKDFNIFSVLDSHGDINNYLK